MRFLRLIFVIGLLMSFGPQNLAANGQALRAAVWNGDMGKIQQILEENPDSIEAIGDGGGTVFHSIKDPKVCNFLIDWVKKNRPNKLSDYINKPYDTQGFTPLLNIVNRGGIDADPDIIGLLLDAGADIYAKDNEMHGVFRLLENVKKGEVLLSWIKKNNKNLAYFLEARDKSGWTPLFSKIRWALEDKKFLNTDVIEFLLDAGANIVAKDEKGQSIFHELISGSGEVRNVLINLIERKRPNALSQYINIKNSDGDTPLLYAIKKGRDPEFVDFLLKHGAKINVKNKRGQTLFHCVDAFRFSPIMAKALVNITRNPDYKEEISKLVRVGDEYFRTPLYCALEHDLDDLVAALQDYKAPLFLHDSDKQPIVPYANRNPKLLVRALRDLQEKFKDFTIETQNRLMGEILLPSILFQCTSCFPLIEKEKKTEEVLKLFDEYEPKRVCAFLRESIKEKNLTHNVTILIDQYVEIDIIGPVLTCLKQVLSSSSVPCLIFGEHVLEKALKEVGDLGINVKDTVDFFVVDAKQPFSVYLAIPKAYAKRNVPDWNNCKIEDPSWVVHVGFNPKFLRYKKFEDITFDSKRAYADIPRSEFGANVVRVVAVLLPPEPQKERVVVLNGHGTGFESDGQEREPGAVGLPLSSFMDLIDILENRGTAFVFLTTCFMGGANMSVFEKFINNDLFNSSIARMIGIHKEMGSKRRGSNMFVTSLAGADVVSYGGFSLDSFFSATEIFLKLLKSEARKDVIPRIYDWITKMLRTVGFEKCLSNNPQVRLPGKDTKFYVTNINGDVQVINALSVGKKDTHVISKKGSKPYLRDIGKGDIHVINKNLLVTYLHDITLPVMLEQKLPVILTAGADCYVRLFQNIDVQIPDVGIAAFLLGCFFRGTYSFGFADDMAHRETYLIKKLALKTDDIFEDTTLPKELKNKKIDCVYNLLLTRGLEETPLVAFSIEEDPVWADFYSIAKEEGDEDVAIITKVDDPSWIRAEVCAIMAGRDSVFEPDEMLFLTKHEKFVEKNKKNLEMALPDIIRRIVSKSLVRDGQYLDRFLSAYLQLMENKATKPFVEKEWRAILDRCKNLVPWVRFETVKTVIRSFHKKNEKPSESIKKNLETLIEELFKRRPQKGSTGNDEKQKDMYDMLQDQLKQELSEKK